MRTILEDELLQVVERALVVHLLTHLHQRVPGVRRELLLAVRALKRLHDRFDDEALPVCVLTFQTFFLTFDSYYFLANFMRPVLGCIEADFYKQLLV